MRSCKEKKKEDSFVKKELREGPQELKKKRRRHMMHHLVSYQVARMMVMMMYHIMSPKGIRRPRTRARRRIARTRAAAPRRNMPPYPLTILICLTVTVSLLSTYPRESYLISMGQTLPSGST
jgi:hypothetical protein